MNNHKFIFQIEKDVNEVFDTLLNDIVANQFVGGDIAHIKHIVSEYLSKSILGKSQLLLDNLLNYLTESSIEILSKENNQIVNEFYNQNISISVKEKLSKKIDLPSIVFTSDNRKFYSGIIGTGIAIGGGIIGLKVSESVWLKTLLGITSISTGIWTYNKIYDYTYNQTLLKLKMDLTLYLDNSKKLINSWLVDVSNTYQDIFVQFCKSKGIVLS